MDELADRLLWSTVLNFGKLRFLGIFCLSPRTYNKSSIRPLQFPVTTLPPLRFFQKISATWFVMPHFPLLHFFSTSLKSKFNNVILHNRIIKHIYIIYVQYYSFSSSEKASFAYPISSLLREEPCFTQIRTI